jgi:hypothetical protein
MIHFIITVIIVCSTASCSYDPEYYNAVTTS